MPLAATMLALGTLSLWSFLAYFGARLDHLPPFLLVGIALCVSGLLSIFHMSQWKVAVKTLWVGVGGIFGYHFLFFLSLQLAPAVEANLINYLWPLLIVLLGPLFLPRYSLRAYHVVGALLGLLGAGLIVTGGRVNLDWANLPGYLCALAAAFIWACYSLMTKRLSPFPTAAVGGFCLISGILSLLIHSVWGPPVWPRGDDWLLLILLGVGPMGLAFFSWDAALKRGDPRIIGALSYLTPLSSTLVLVLFANRALSSLAILAMLLIVIGAGIGSLDLFRQRDVHPTATEREA